MHAWTVFYMQWFQDFNCTRSWHFLFCFLVDLEETLMLVTELAPLGALRSYLPNNKVRTVHCVVSLALPPLRSSRNIFRGEGKIAWRAQRTYVWAAFVSSAFELHFCRFTTFWMLCSKLKCGLKCACLIFFGLFLGHSWNFTTSHFLHANLPRDGILGKRWFFQSTQKTRNLSKEFKILWNASVLARVV